MDGDSYILAVNKDTGKQVWKTKRTVFNPNWSTPVMWQTDKGNQLIVLGGGALKAYAPNTGSELWAVPDFGAPIPVPVIGDNFLFASAASGVEAGVTKSPLRWVYYEEFDTNKDGKVHTTEIPESAKIIFNPDQPEEKLPARSIVRWMDRNGDSAMTKVEFKNFINMINMNVRSSIKAITPGGGKAAAGKSKVAWKYERSIPHMTSSIYFDGKIYLANSGGRVTCLDAKTGAQIYRKRLGKGSYSASPVIANGHIYICSLDGLITVFQTGKVANVVASIDLGQRISATPAIANDTLFIRTATHLHAFSK